jgi:hypothetical protein
MPDEEGLKERNWLKIGAILFAACEAIAIVTLIYFKSRR